MVDPAHCSLDLQNACSSIQVYSVIDIVRRFRDLILAAVRCFMPFMPFICRHCHVAHKTMPFNQRNVTYTCVF